MGVVYKARDRRLDRTVAVKFILGADPNLTMRLVREARAQARLDHPNVCRVYEVGEVEGRAYIAMQFVDGEPLGRAAAKMTLDEKVAVMRDVAIGHPRGAQARHRPPRSQAGQHHGRAQRRRAPGSHRHGLRARARGDARGRASPSRARSSARRRTCRPSRRAATCAPSIGARDVYSLGATLYELLDRAAAVRQRVAGAGAGAGHPRRRAGAAQPGADGAARSRDHRRQVSGQGSGAALRLGARARRRSRRATSTASRSSGAARRCCSGSRCARAAIARCSRSAPGRPRSSSRSPSFGVRAWIVSRRERAAQHRAHAPGRAARDRTPRRSSGSCAPPISCRCTTRAPSARSSARACA